MDFYSTFILFGYGIFRTFWCVCGLLSGLGDIGCAVFIVEQTTPKNLDLSKNLNLIMKLKFEI